MRSVPFRFASPRPSDNDPRRAATIGASGRTPCTESPAAGASADPVDRLKELMKARKDESLKVLSGWIEKREDAI